MDLSNNFLFPHTVQLQENFVITDFLGMVYKVRYIQTRLWTAHQTGIIYSPASLGTREITEPPTLTPTVTVCLLKAADC